MCGVAGIYHYRNPSRPVDTTVLRRMTQSLRHRGPDGEGFYTAPGIGLGHRRLAIIDPGGRGAQPMISACGKWVISYNGEIYNYRELGRELEGRGRVLKTRTDTEVALNAFAEWGAESLARFNGIFAFALYGLEKKVLYLVRDRFGVKPLFYHDDGETVRFGSEVKSVLADEGIPRRVCHAGLSSYLAFGYIHAPYTGFEGVKSLEPATVLRIDEGGPVLKTVYWELRRDKERPPRSFGACVELFGEKFEAAVKRQMVSDVPIGAFLSGGLDSTAVVHAMTQSASEPVRAFTTGFTPSGPLDESRHAAETARRLKLTHKIESLGLNMADTLIRAAAHCEEPFSDSSLLCFYHVAKTAAASVKVALSGDGGDELMAGYGTYYAGYAAPFFRPLPAFLRKNALRPLLSLASASDDPYAPAELARRFLAGIDEPAGRDHASWRIYLSKNEQAALLFPDAARRIMKHDPVGEYARFYREAPAGSGALRRMLRADLLFYLPNDMLVKVDRMSMAHSLETRVPMLDNTLVDYLAALPARYLLAPGFGKKRVLRAYLKKELHWFDVNRPKRGFNAPIAEGFRGELYELFMDAIREKPFAATPFFRREALEKLAGDHRTRKRDARYALFSILTLALWWNKYAPSL